MLHRSIPFFFLLLLCTVAIAQPQGSLNRTDEKGRKQGQWAKTWENGSIRYQGQFEDDRPVGEFKHYDEEGILKTIQVYGEDGTTSHARHLHPDGSLMAEGIYRGQQKDSVWNYYDEEGSLRKKENFDQGKLNGEQITYFPNGQGAEKANYSNGKLHGEQKTWFPSSLLRSEAIFADDNAHGKMIHYFPSGKKELEGNMLNGRRDGTWIHFNNDGNIHLFLVYKQGELVKEKRENGTFMEYFPDEKPKSLVTYKKGKKEGSFTEWHNNGDWVMERIPPDATGTESNEMERVLKGQTKKLEGTYKNDLLEGEVKEYDEKGRLLKVTTYAAGEVTGEEVKR